jgi:polyisoprenoid-binding protein YceI
MLYHTQALLYPTVSYQANEFDFNGDFNQNIELMGTLIFHGVASKFPIDISLKKNGNEYWGTCKFSISLKAFNIERPTLLMIPIKDTIEIEAKLKIIEK